MPLLKRLSTMAAKVETTIGTAETLTASEGAFNAYDISIQANIDSEEREAQGSFDMLSQVVGARGGTMTFKTDIAVESGAGNPGWSELLKGCGYSESSQVWTPKSEALGSVGAVIKSMTIGVFINGLYKVLAGAVGTFKIVCPSGKMVTIEWEFRGVWQAVTDSALIAPTYPTGPPSRFGSAVITYGGVAQCVENVTFDAGNEIILRECPDTAAGFVSGLIVSRKPMITLNPEMQLVATEDKYGSWLAGTESAFSCTIDGTTGLVTNSNVIISAPKAQIINIQESDRNRMMVDEVTLSCNKNAAAKDQDVTITFTDKADA
jgi:hypothetical protein